MGGGSFNVFNAWLQEQNDAFVRDPDRAPAWQVLKLQTLDDRLPAGDDPLTLRAILELYSPVLMQRDYLLLKRRQQKAASPFSVSWPIPAAIRTMRTGKCKGCASWAMMHASCKLIWGEKAFFTGF